MNESKEFRVQSLELKIEPNPFVGNTVIKQLSNQAIKELNIQIYDITGRLVEEDEPRLKDCKVGANLQAGIYFLK